MTRVAVKSKYDERIHDDWGWLLATKGLTGAEIAKEMGISRSTLNKWIAEHESFAEAITQGRDSSDAKVVKSLFKRAVGYAFKERKIVNMIGEDGKPTPARIETTEKHVQPDTTAQIFWLKNRRPNDWRDRRDVEMTSGSDITFNVKPASEEKPNKGET